jgi:hypothetical protein
MRGWWGRGIVLYITYNGVNTILKSCQLTFFQCVCQSSNGALETLIILYRLSNHLIKTELFTVTLQSFTDNVHGDISLTRTMLMIYIIFLRLIEKKIDISLYLLRGNVFSVLMKLYILKTDFFLDSFHENKRNPSIIHWSVLVITRSYFNVTTLIDNQLLDWSLPPLNNIEGSITRNSSDVLAHNSK